MDREGWVDGRTVADARTSTVGDTESFSFLVLEMCVRLSVCPFDGLLFHSALPPFSLFSSLLPSLACSVIGIPNISVFL